MRPFLNRAYQDYPDPKVNSALPDYPDFQVLTELRALEVRLEFPELWEKR